MTKQETPDPARASAAPAETQTAPAARKAQDAGAGTETPAPTSGARKIPGLTGNALKLIAVAAMTLDHVLWAVWPGYDNGPVVLLLHCIGRLTMPIMCFFIAEGFHYTHDRKKYALRLFAFAIVSHFAYCFAFGIPFLPLSTGVFNQTSVLWAYAWAVVALVVASYAPSSAKPAASCPRPLRCSSSPQKAEGGLSGGPLTRADARSVASYAPSGAKPAAFCPRPLRCSSSPQKAEGGLSGGPLTHADARSVASYAPSSAKPADAPSSAKPAQGSALQAGESRPASALTPQGQKRALPGWAVAVAVLAICVITFPSDWSCIAVMVILGFASHRGEFRRQALELVLWVGMYTVIYCVFIDVAYGLVQMAVVLALPLLRAYNGQRGRRLTGVGGWVQKWFFYLYYPLHLLLIGLLRLWLHGNIGLMVGGAAVRGLLAAPRKSRKTFFNPIRKIRTTRVTIIAWKTDSTNDLRRPNGCAGVFVCPKIRKELLNMADRKDSAAAALGLLESAAYEPERSGGAERYRIRLGDEVRAFTAEELIAIAEACAAGKRWDELGVEGVAAGEVPPGESAPPDRAETDAEPTGSGEERLYALERDTLAEDNPIGAVLTEEERARATAEFEKFVAQYPDVLDLPVEVVQSVRRGKSLLDAYRAHENGALKAKIAALEQNERNARSTPGSALGDADGDSDTAELMAIFDSVFR